jgi:hypothetical protein
MKAWMTLALAVLMTACAAASDGKTVNAAQIRQNKEIEDTYGSLVGTYSGKLTNTDHGDETIKLVIYITTDAATNPDGTTGSREVPRAVFKRMDPVVSDYSLLAAGYTRENGVLSLVTDGSGNPTPIPGAPPATNPANQIKSVAAFVNGKHITGSVQMLTGTLGNIDLTFESSDTGSSNDLKDRLLAAYQAVEGEYTGTISDGSKKPKTPVIIELTAVVNGDSPMLIGFYKRPDVPGGEIDLALTVSYRPDQSPAQITMNGKGGGKYAINMDGTLVNHVISVSFNSLFQGYLGVLTAKRTKKKP